MTKLTKAQATTLAIFGRIRGKNALYWGSPKTSAQLAQMGLLEPYLPPFVAERPWMTTRPFRITPEGLTALKEE